MNSYILDKIMLIKLARQRYLPLKYIPTSTHGTLVVPTQQEQCQIEQKSWLNPMKRNCHSATHATLHVIMKEGEKFLSFHYLRAEFFAASFASLPPVARVREESYEQWSKCLMSLRESLAPSVCPTSAGGRDWIARATINCHN